MWKCGTISRASGRKPGSRAGLVCTKEGVPGQKQGSKGTPIRAAKEKKEEENSKN